MELKALVEILKFAGIGTGGAGIIIAVVIAVGYLKIKEHSKKVEKLETRTNGQETTLVDHGKVLVKIDTQTKTLIKGQEGVFKKLDSLTEVLLKK